MRRAALLICVMGVSLAATLSVLEAALWIVRPRVQYAYMPYWPRVSHFRSSDLLPMELKPNGRFRFNMPEFDTTIATNELGLRSAPIDRSRPRIVCMGDSLTFGFGVENDETYCAVLERLFGGAYQFLNAGFADGNAPDTYALWLRRDGPKVRPSGVIVMIVDNDYEDVNDNVWTGDSGGLPQRISRPGMIVTPDGALMRDGRAARMPVWARAFIEHSYLLALVRDRVLRDAEPARPSASAPGAAAAPVSRAESDARFLTALDRLTREAGERLLAFYYVRVRDGKTEPPAEHLLRQFADQRGIRVLANPDEFNRDDYFTYDNHWNAAGHAVAARYLHRELQPALAALPR